jgi:hypothetical protein
LKGLAIDGLHVAALWISRVDGVLFSEGVVHMGSEGGRNEKGKGGTRGRGRNARESI